MSRMRCLQFIEVLFSTVSTHVFLPLFAGKDKAVTVLRGKQSLIASLGYGDLFLGSKEVDSMREMHYMLCGL